MAIDRKLDPVKRKRMRHAERKLKEAQQQLARTERSILPHGLDGEISVGLEDADRPPGADSVAMQEEHDLADLHALLPGIGDPLPALWPNPAHGLEIGGVVANHLQDFGAEVADQLLRQDGPDSHDEAAAQVGQVPSAPVRPPSVITTDTRPPGLRSPSPARKRFARRATSTRLHPPKPTTTTKSRSRCKEPSLR